MTTFINENTVHCYSWKNDCRVLTNHSSTSTGLCVCGCCEDLSLLIINLITAQTEFSAKHVDKLEQLIDKMEDELPPLKNFILPVSS